GFRQFIYAEVREAIGFFIAGVAAVALHPLPVDRVACGLHIERLPQVGIQYRLLRGRFPATLLPGREPLRDAVQHVLRVAVERSTARAFQRRERTDDGGQLHPVVRREGLSAVQRLARAAGFEDGAPAARTGVAAAGA